MPQSTPHFELLARVLDAFEFEDAASRMRAAETLVTAALMHRITGAVPATSIEGPVPQRLALLQVIESLARGAAELFLFGHGLDTGKPPQSALQTASVYAWSSIMGHDRPRPTIMFDQVALSQPVKASELKQLLTCPAYGLAGMMAGVSEDARVQWVFASEDGSIFRQSVFQKGLALRVRLAPGSTSSSPPTIDGVEAAQWCAQRSSEVIDAVEAMGTTYASHLRGAGQRLLGRNATTGPAFEDWRREVREALLFAGASTESTESTETGTAHLPDH
jgi:hypothetical protein